MPTPPHDPEDKKIKSKEKHSPIKTKDLIRLVAFVVFIIVAVTATVFLIPFVRQLLTQEGRHSIEMAVEELGSFAWLAFIGLQILQVVIAMIPGEPIQLMAGVLFGTWIGLALCLIGWLLGSALIFLGVRLIGKPLVEAFIPAKWMNKFKFLQSESRLEAVIFLLFLIPGIPKDVLTYFVPLTTMRIWKFLIISTVARIPAMMVSTIAGEHIGKGNWLVTAIVILVSVLLLFLGFIFKDKLLAIFHKKH